jgi:basic membrane protein A and related proteins
MKRFVVILANLLVATLIFAGSPSTLRIAIIGPTTIEEPWNTALIQSLDRIKAAKPHNLTVVYDFHERIDFPDAERVLAELAKSGKYDMIVAHSAYSDAIAQVNKRFSNICWVYTGGGNKPIGGNAYWIDVAVNEPSYLFGVLAGMMTKSNLIGSVGSFPVPNENSALNAYRAGVKSVNPKAKVKIMFIENWFDPAKAKESALAQISAGADFIYAISFGVFEACKEKNILAFGFNVDQSSLAPDVVISSSVMRWDPTMNYTIDEWWNHEAKGTAYNAPMKAVLFPMKDGGSEFAPYHDVGSKIPKNVKNKIEQIRKDIMSGKFVVPYSEVQPVSE